MNLYGHIYHQQNLITTYVQELQRKQTAAKQMIHALLCLNRLAPLLTLSDVYVSDNGTFMLQHAGNNLQPVQELLKAALRQESWWRHGEVQNEHAVFKFWLDGLHFQLIVQATPENKAALAELLKD